MEAVLLLGAAAAVLRVGRSHALALAAAVLLAAWGATTLPDWDMALGLGHRSGLTHSVLPAAMCAGRRWRALAAGVLLGLGLHLAADLFPNGMRGFATVKLPGTGSIGAAASYAWLAVNAALALAGGAWLLGRTVPGRLGWATLAGVGAVGFAYLLRTDGGWWALAMFAGLGWAARSLPSLGRKGSGVGGRDANGTPSTHP